MNDQPQLFDTGPEPREVDSWPERRRNILEVFVTEYREPQDAMPDTVVVMLAQQNDSETPSGIMYSSLGWLLHEGYIAGDKERLTITTKGLAALGLGGET